MEKIVFATNYNEGEDFLDLYINNFLSHTDEKCFLVINLSPGRRLVSSPRHTEDRVFIFNGETHRSKWGMGIALGHFESYAYAAQNCGDFDYFCTLASNSLFFRAIDKKAIIARLEGGHMFPETSGRDYKPDYDVPVSGYEAEGGTWAWQGFNQSHHFRECLATTCRIERCTVTQIEGLFARKEDWDVILNDRDALYALQTALTQDPDDPRYYMAVEEMIFSTYILQHGSGKFTHLCYMFWEGLGRVGAKELLTTLPGLPSYLCSAKWFERSIFDPGAVLVGTPVGRALFAACKKSSAGQRSVVALQLQAALNSLDKAAFFSTTGRSIAAHWEDFPGWSGRLLSEGIIHLGRQTETVIPEVEQPQERFAPFFLTEAAHVDFDLSVSMTDLEDELQVVLTGVFPQARRSTTLAGYLYFSARRPVSEFVLTFDTHEAADRLIDKIVLYDNYHYFTIPSVDKRTEWEGGCRLHYIVKDEMKHQPLSIGIPCYGRLITALRVSVLETEDQGAIENVQVDAMTA